MTKKKDEEQVFKFVLGCSLVTGCLVGIPGDIGVGLFVAQAVEFAMAMQIARLVGLDYSEDNIFKIMNSSGTSGQKPSTIYLDRENSIMQTKVLTKVVSNFIGNKRLPMLIIDSKNVISNRKIFSARGAGIIGFSMPKLVFP